MALMEQLHFNGLPQDVHHCSSQRDGDWIIWRCAQCANYERRLNWVTGEMRIRRDGSLAQHVGLADHREPEDLLAAKVCLN